MPAAPHMMDYPLLLSTLYERAVRIYPEREIVSVNGDGSLHRTTYGETDGRVRRLAGALERLGIEPGDPVGTLAWNTHQHHELYWATANTGRICHTVNLRLAADQIRYIIDHAGDLAVFVSADMVEAAAALAPRLPNVRNWILLEGNPAGASLPGALDYEELIADARAYEGGWPELDERSPHMYCYTSGTTGHPKGVAYTQRSTYMHTLSNLVVRPLESSVNFMPVVPMFHAAAWGYPFMATAVGAKLTYPGRDLSPGALVGLIEGEKVTHSAGVPTVWLGIQNYLMSHSERDTSSIRSVLSGGSAAPRAMIDWYRRERGIRVAQGWGMTETNPVSAIADLRLDKDWDWERQLDFLDSTGLPILGLKVKIVDDEGRELPHDGEAFGELLIQGPWIAAEYLRDDRTAETMVDGWLRTGDVCKITPEGYIRITDRAKDVIKSGGEWISSIDLENMIMAHPKVAEAAVVGIAHPRWQERPLAVVVAQPGEQVTGEELNAHLEGRAARWWLPDRYLFVDEVPKTGTGKFDKKVVRDRYSDLFLDRN